MRVTAVGCNVTYLSEIADRSVRATRAIRLRGENALMGPRVRMEVSNKGPRVTWPWNPTPNVEEHDVRMGHPAAASRTGGDARLSTTVQSYSENSRRAYSIAASRDVSRPSSWASSTAAST